MKNWPSNFQSFSFQSSNFQFYHFNLLTFNYCQFSIPLDLNYLLPLSEPKRRCFDFFFFVIKKIKKNVIKKKNIFFSHSLSCRTLSLSFSFSISLSHSAVVQGLTASTHNLLATASLHLSISLSSSLTPPKSETQSLTPPLHQNLKPKENNLTPSPP